jgi:hypothetical protein
VGGSIRRLTGDRDNPGGRIAALLIAASVLTAWVARSTSTESARSRKSSCRISTWPERTA